MMLNENRIPYLETQKSFLCESKCNSPANVANIMESCFRISDLPEEHIYAIALNTKNQITGIFEVGKGTVNCSLISAREILIRMLLAGAVSFILCHNHPSGDTNPSQEDIQITESIGKAGRNRQLGIRPSVRGMAMNPVDHPHGGGEGRSKSGKHPQSPWGKCAKGTKTRKKVSRFILKRRK